MSTNDDDLLAQMGLIDDGQPHEAPVEEQPEVTETDEPSASGGTKQKKEAYGQARQTPIEDIVHMATEAMLDLDEMSGQKAGPKSLRADILSMTRTYLVSENAHRGSREQLTIPQALNIQQVAMILQRRHRFVTITPDGGSGGDDTDLFALYQESGPDAGIYTSEESQFRELVRLYNGNFKLADCTEVLSIVRDRCPQVVENTDPDLIAVNNGILNYKTKELSPFDPEVVFVAKSTVDWDPDAESPRITMPDGETWEVESWMAELSDDPEVVDLLWHVLGAVVRPNVKWGRAVFPFSEGGNNGKGSHAQLSRNLIGERYVADISLNTFGKNFGLDGIVRAQAVITDENDVGTWLELGGNFKAAVTWDILDIDRKHKSRINYRFRGLIIECLNGFPKSRDKSDSWYRRQLFIPFDKRFEGQERKYIKTDYLFRPEVLRYVLKRVMLMPEFYELPVPDACKAVLEAYKEANDPVRAFWNHTLEVSEDGSDMWRGWQMLPVQVAFDIFLAWCSSENIKVDGYTKGTFTKESRLLLAATGEWVDMTDAKAKAIPTAHTMVGVPPIAQDHRGNMPKWSKWLAPESPITGVKGMLPDTTFAKEMRGFVRRSFVELKTRAGSWADAAAAVELAPLVAKDAATEADPHRKLADSPLLAGIEEQAREGIINALQDDAVA